MKVVLANIFNQNQMIIVKTYDEKNVIAEEFDDFDNAVHFLVKNGFTIKSENANERGEYSLWFEKVTLPVKAKKSERESLRDLDDAYTKMMANQIARQNRMT